MSPTLYIVVPCYNEQEVLPLTAPVFLKKLTDLTDAGKISGESALLLVDDGSRDGTWEIIRSLSAGDGRVRGIRLSRNRGHQNALLAGLTEAMDCCDITVSIDCDGQDDINAVDAMVEQYAGGCEVVYGVRNSRASDTFFKRFTARAFYKLLAAMGAEVVYDHADYRLISSRVLKELARFEEVNLFLRGMVPLVGFQSGTVYYDRSPRLAGESHYPLKKMIALAVNGITGLSVRPLGMIFSLGALLFLFSAAGLVASLCLHSSLWAAACTVCAVSSLGILCLGVVGEYIGKIYLETKHRPRYIIRERTEEEQ